MTCQKVPHKNGENKRTINSEQHCLIGETFVCTIYINDVGTLARIGGGLTYWTNENVLMW